MFQVKLHFALGRSAVGPNAVDVCQQSQNLAYLAGWVAFIFITYTAPNSKTVCAHKLIAKTIPEASAHEPIDYTLSW